MLKLSSRWLQSRSAEARRIRRTLTVVLLAGVVAAMVPSVAVADDGLAPEGRVAAQWYANDWLKFDELHAAGVTGKGMKIAVIDSAINPDVPELQGTNLKVVGSTCMDADGENPLNIVSDDPALSAHGTNAVSMLIGNGVAGDGGVGARGIVPDAEVWFYGIGQLEKGMTGCVKNDPSAGPGKQDVIDDLKTGGPVLDNREGQLSEGLSKTLQQGGDPTVVAARVAIRDGVDVISMSVLTASSFAWSQVMIEAKKAGVLVVVATKNPVKPFSGGIDNYAYMNNGVVAVSAITEDHALLADPEGGWEVEGASNLAVLGPGRNLLGVGTEKSGWGPALIHGTSYATPVVAGSLALGLQKFPDASPDQVLQALVRTTGDGVVHEPVWTDRTHGYGELNALGMLGSDSSKFPDENPLYVSSLDDPRCVFRDGSLPGIDDSGGWVCSWARSPNPEEEAEYWAARAPEKGDEVKAEAPAAETPVSDDEPDVMAVALWAGGGLLLLGMIATAVIVPILVSRGRRGRAAQVSLPDGQIQGIGSGSGAQAYPADGLFAEVPILNPSHDEGTVVDSSVSRAASPASQTPATGVSRPAENGGA